MKKFKCSIVLSQPHGLLPAEWVAVRCHHAQLTQFDYRHFYNFHEGGERKFCLADYPSISVYARIVLRLALLYKAGIAIRWQQLPTRALIFAG
ncbi:hypothetical protein [Desulfosarcina sp.]|uniref:hypothetical protein n=1 Tax=Desulfosarcina sp. TaxID=2027861 RepID=UPI003561EE13